jgi:RNA polymerase primary sigma factor
MKSPPGSFNNVNNRNIRLYFKEIGSIPLLTADEEKQLGHRARSGDQEAVKKLVESNLRFVVRVARKYSGFGLALQDLIDEGNIGLIEAARRYNPNKNVRFTSYAVWWIQQYIRQAFYAMAHPFRVPARVKQLMYKLGMNTYIQASKRMRPVTLNEVAEDMRISRKELQDILAICGEEVSLDQPLDAARSETLENRLEKRMETVEQELIEQSLRKSVRNSLQLLTTKELEIIKLRFGLQDDSLEH